MNPKKVKVDHSVVGKIHSVRCENFMTYSDVTIFPHKQLNVIIGPNGTGKSTIAAAISLGMGGSTKLLSRSNKIGEFIQTGKESATVTILLYNNIRCGTKKFQRSFKKSSESTWKVDNEIVTEKQFLKEVSAFNIQVDNLCQFLPQDRVQDFSKMNPKALLENTQKSVCNDEVNTLFQKLKEIQKEQFNLQNTMEQKEKELKKNEEELLRLKDGVVQIETRKNFMKELTIYKMKKHWLNYQQQVAVIETLKSDLKTAKEHYEQKSQSLNSLKKKMQHFDRIIQDLQNNMSNEGKNKNIFENKLNEFDQKCENLERSIRNAKLELDEKKTECVEKKRMLENACLIQETTKQDLNDAKVSCGNEDKHKEELNDIQNRIESIKNEIINHNKNYREINNRLDIEFEGQLISLKRRIERIENVANIRLGKLENMSPDAYKAVKWVRENRHLFDDMVYEPMILEMNLKNPSHAKYFENIISKADLLAFTCCSKSDMELLSEKLSKEMKLKLSFLYSEKSDRCRYMPKESINAFKKYGFHAYVRDFVDAPAPILNYLCQTYGIQNILVGNDTADMHSDNLPHYIRMFIAGNKRYTLKFSAYTGEKSTTKIPIMDRNWLNVTVNQEELTSLKNQLKHVTVESDSLKNARNEVQSLISENEKKKQEFLEEKKAKEANYSKILDIKSKLKRQIEICRNLNSKQIDIKTETEKFQSICKDAIEKLYVVQSDRIKCLQKCNDSYGKHEYFDTKLHVIKKENVELFDELKSAEEEYTSYQKIVENILKEIDKKERICKEKYDEAIEVSGGKSIKDPKFPYRRYFTTLPDDMNELEDRIQELQSRIDCFSDERGDVIAKYEATKQKVDELQLLMQNKTKSEESLEADRAKFHRIWYNKITEIIREISEHFSKFMASMSYAGEVQLNAANERDYDSYGVCINVQFRKTGKLCALDGYVQSGGERAVAIAVYSLSLQNLTHVPFRCVDEINQGMDPNNERKIYDMLVRETAREGKSQYFFITPKLLPNLAFNDQMQIHIVHNGQGVANANVFKIS